MNVEQLMELELVVEREVLGENQAKVPLCSTHIPHDLIWDRTQVAKIGSR
jgi:hypothetical protein